MRSFALCLLAVTVVGCELHSANAGARNRVAGTYELMICKTACSFSNPENAFATATIMLFERTLALKEMTRINPIFIDTHDVRTCYVVNAEAGAQSYVHTTANTGTWEAHGNSIQFNLFRSPDAGYLVEVERRGNSFVGTGKSWGVGMGAPPKEYGPDVVIGRRVGPADATKCRTNT